MTEQLANLATSVLSAPITTTGAVSLTVTSPTKFPSGGNFRIRVDSEHMLVTARAGSTFTVTRGIEGSTAATHIAGAEVRHVITVTGLDTRVTETMAGLRGASNGYASLGAGGTIPPAQLPASVVEYKGGWDATANNPVLSDATGSLGDEYKVSTAGTRNLGSGSKTWGAGDLLIHNGTIWEQFTGGGGGGAVNSVAGKTGTVTLVEGDIGSLVADLAAKATQASVDALTASLAAKADATALNVVGPRVLTSVTGTPYTFALADAGKVFDGNTACVLKIPALATTNFPEGSWFEVCNTQGLTVEIQSATGTMIETPLSPGVRVASVFIKPQYGSCRFRKRAVASDFWIASGDHSLT